MDPAAIISLTAAGSGAAGYVFKRVVDHLLGRRPLRVDEATKIRAELRAERDHKDQQIAELEERKDKKIDALEKRIESLEAQLEKAEQRILLEERSKLAVYRALLEHGATKQLVNAVLAIQESKQ